MGSHLPGIYLIKEMTDQIFKKAGFTPHVLFETSNNATIATMIHAEMCCGLIPEYYARNSPYGIRYFTLPDNPAWNIMACCHKNRYKQIHQRLHSSGGRILEKGFDHAHSFPYNASLLLLLFCNLLHEQLF